MPFVDASSVTDSLIPDFQIFALARAWRSLRYTFGPIRLDFAVPLNKYQNGTAYGIYAGIGQSFNELRGNAKGGHATRITSLRAH